MYAVIRERGKQYKVEPGQKHRNRFKGKYQKR